jgi:hypothetical protein
MSLEEKRRKVETKAGVNEISIDDTLKRDDEIQDVEDALASPREVECSKLPKTTKDILTLHSPDR